MTNKNDINLVLSINNHNQWDLASSSANKNLSPRRAARARDAIAKVFGHIQHVDFKGITKAKAILTEVDDCCHMHLQLGEEEVIVKLNKTFARAIAGKSQQLWKRFWKVMTSRPKTTEDVKTSQVVTNTINWIADQGNKLANFNFGVETIEYFKNTQILSDETKEKIKYAERVNKAAKLILGYKDFIEKAQQGKLAFNLKTVKKVATLVKNTLGFYLWFIKIGILSLRKNSKEFLTSLNLPLAILCSALGFVMTLRETGFNFFRDVRFYKALIALALVVLNPYIALSTRLSFLKTVVCFILGKIESNEQLEKITNKMWETTVNFCQKVKEKLPQGPQLLLDAGNLG